jgi:hypothetical protein
MRVRRREQTISENLALWEANERRLAKIRRALWRLEWRSRWRRMGKWLKHEHKSDRLGA